MSNEGEPVSAPTLVAQTACTGVWTQSGSDMTLGTCAPAGGRRGLKAKTLKRMLKKAGLKVSGKKSTLTKRAKKAHLMRGGDASASAAPSTAAGYPFAPGMVGGGYGALPNAATHAGLVGGRRHGVKAKTLKKLLKKAGLKVSGKKATLRARAKKAHLVRG
jgi:hypothetical protein